MTVELLASLNEAAKSNVGKWTCNVGVHLDRLHHALSMTLEGAIRRSVEHASRLQDQDALASERIVSDCKAPTLGHELPTPRVEEAASRAGLPTTRWMSDSRFGGPRVTAGAEATSSRRRPE